MVTGRTALLIIRAWLEHGSLKPLRAQIRLTTDVSHGLDEKELTLTDVAAVGDAVEAWLLDVSADGQTPTEPQAARRASDEVTAGPSGRSLVAGD
jgi:hypothetical protein